jgi:GNAT superfamily N-acetyltransferase
MKPIVEMAGPERLATYSKIPIAFEVTRKLAVDLIDCGIGGIRLREEEVQPPYVKDYDDSEEGGPDRWGERFNLEHFVVFLATQAGSPVGGAALVYDSPKIHMLAGRDDIAVLWDIRVVPALRRGGLGTVLFARAAAWAREQGLRALKIETQNVNLPACRFYMKQGCILGEIDRYAYAGDPVVGEEVMLVWYLHLPGC